jgi:16S rRNA (cytosine967-C5)-methyltransferase
VREENQLNIILKIIERYRLDKPLSRYLKEFFKTHPQMGSRDRRTASGFVYNYFRTGNSLRHLRMIERLTVSNFICSDMPNPLLSYCIEKYSLLKPVDISLLFQEKIHLLKQQDSQFNLEKLFPFAEHLSDQIDREQFVQSFLRQPVLWIRIRKDFYQTVLKEFESNNILFKAEDQHPLSVSLSNATSLEKTESWKNGYFEIQDWSSQQTIQWIQPKPNECWWDACCGSGGKSLMMKDAEPSIKILATDHRTSILENLKERTARSNIAGIFPSLIDLTSTIVTEDLLKLISATGLDKFPDSVVADVPCTGSGTWARTPEWLAMFHVKEIDRYVDLQRSIMSNLSRLLKSKTRIVYITCSVFKEENELNIRWLESNCHLQHNQSAYVQGVSRKADSMFVSVFEKI